MLHKSIAEVENELNLLIERMEYSPSNNKDAFFSDISSVNTLLESIKDGDLLGCLFKTKVLEWLLHFALRFRQVYEKHDADVNNLAIKITEILLVNIRIVSLLICQLNAFPLSFPKIITDNLTPPALQSILDGKFNTFFILYLDKINQNDPKLYSSKYNFFTEQAKEYIAGKMLAPDNQPGLFRI